MDYKWAVLPKLQYQVESYSNLYSVILRIRHYKNKRLDFNLLTTTREVIKTGRRGVKDDFHIIFCISI